MANETTEDMRRITLTFTLDQALLEVEGKHATSGRLYSTSTTTPLRRAAAAKLFRAIAERLAEAIVAKTNVALRVNPDTFEILASQ